MKQLSKKMLYWTPRILCLAFAAFLSLFSLDVFSEDRDLWETVLGLVMHNIPTFAVLIVLAFSWRWEWVGAVLFTALGIFYLVWAWGKFHISAYIFISGPLFLMAGLFLANWVMRKQLRSET